MRKIREKKGKRERKYERIMNGKSKRKRKLKEEKMKAKKGKCKKITKTKMELMGE